MKALVIAGFVLIVALFMGQIGKAASQKLQSAGICAQAANQNINLGCK